MTMNKSESPLFIIGSPRSGTSLLRLILTSHSQILIPPECGFMIWLRPKYGNWSLAENTTLLVESFLEDLFECKKFDTWQLNRKLIEGQILDSKPASYAELCRAVYASFGTSINKHFKIWGDKNNFHLHHLDELLELFKTARFLHIVRDGRDVACSYREVMAAKSKSPYAPNLKTNITDIALEWSTNVMKIDAFMSRMPREVAMTIRYEDLVRTPSSSVISICDWLGIAYEADMLEFHRINISKKLEPELTLDWKKRTLQPISNETVGRHIKLFSDNDNLAFLNICSDVLHRFFYA